MFSPFFKFVVLIASLHYVVAEPGWWQLQKADVDGKKVCAEVESGTHGNDDEKECACKEKGCEFDLITKKCAYYTEVCAAVWSEASSLRIGTSYVSGGKICKVPMESFKKPFVQETIIALNLGKGGQIFSDRKIMYEEETADHFKDDNEIRGISEEGSKCPHADPSSGPYINSLASGEIDLFTNTVFGDKAKQGTKGCISYPMALSTPGTYELSVKLAEKNLPEGEKRALEIRINDKKIVTVTNDHYDPTCDGTIGMELVIELNLDGNALVVHGFKDESITLEDGGKLELKFCYGGCHTSFQTLGVAAFSVLRMDSEPTLPNTKCKQKDGVKGNECACKETHHSCEFDLVEGICKHESEICPELLGKATCLRAGSYFSSNGVVCNVSKHAAAGFKECEINEPISAINYYGVLFTGGYGITYKNESAGDFEYDAEDMRDSHPPYGVPQMERKCRHMSPSAATLKQKAIYFTVNHGISKLADVGHCLRYPIKGITEDGTYELGIKFCDGNPGHTAFNVLLNEHKILSRFDVAPYAGICEGMDVFFQFSVTGNKIAMAGNPAATDIADGTVTLSYCYNDKKTNCGGTKPDPSYVCSAHHIAKLKE